MEPDLCVDCDIRTVVIGDIRCSRCKRDYENAEFSLAKKQKKAEKGLKNFIEKKRKFDKETAERQANLVKLRAMAEVPRPPPSPPPSSGSTASASSVPPSSYAPSASTSHAPPPTSSSSGPYPDHERAASSSGRPSGDSDMNDNEETALARRPPGDRSAESQSRIDELQRRNDELSSRLQAQIEKFEAYKNNMDQDLKNTFANDRDENNKALRARDEHIEKVNQEISKLYEVIDKKEEDIGAISRFLSVLLDTMGPGAIKKITEKDPKLNLDKLHERLQEMIDNN